MSIEIIAEIGVNHNGDLALAKELIHAASEAGADTVKFQMFQVDKLCSAGTPLAAYQNRDSLVTSQSDLLKDLALQNQDFLELEQLSYDLNLTFLCTPFDSDSLAFLTDEMQLKRIKIGSGEITNLPFLYEIARKATKIILSTGASTVREIDLALGALLSGIRGYLEPNGCPPLSLDKIDPQTREEARQRVVLMHCTSQYPAPLVDLNLRAIYTLGEFFQFPIGFSDHSRSLVSGAGAVALGATIIEKHLTLDNSMRGPDHVASLNPSDFQKFANNAREIDSSLGDGVKRPMASELKNRDAIRRSLFAGTHISAGSAFTFENIVALRPGIGTPPAQLWHLLGTRATKNYAAGDPI